MQTRIARRGKYEQRHEDHGRGKDRDDGHLQKKILDLARRFVVRATGTATVIVVTGANRVRGLIVVLDGNFWIGVVIAVVVSVRMVMPAW